jgi:hypothetical protein
VPNAWQLRFKKINDKSILGRPQYCGVTFN